MRLKRQVILRFELDAIIDIQKLKIGIPGHNCIPEVGCGGSMRVVYSTHSLWSAGRMIDNFVGCGYGWDR